MATTVHNVSVSGRLLMNLHSLNNEGTEGNQTLTRMVTVYVPANGGSLESVNAVSGDMFKHVFAEHLREQAIASELPLSEGARVGSANRYNQDFVGLPEKQRDAMSNIDVLDHMIATCTVSDVCGLLVTEGNKSAPRKSVAEFGWVTGIPEKVRTESFFHVKYDPRRESGSGQETLGQAIFHRPASSGAYATVAQLELARIGVNDFSMQPVPKVDRPARAKAALKALLHTYVNPQGAHRNTQNPHITGFQGVVTWSRCAVPAPVLSALDPDFVDQVERVSGELNRIHGDGTVTVRPFGTLADFAGIIGYLIEESEPPR
jgi:CRISPR-associated protein Cst2